MPFGSGEPGEGARLILGIRHDKRCPPDGPDLSRSVTPTMGKEDRRLAVILAGGLGTRLRPYTVVLPKPLMPVGESPILEIIIQQLKLHRFDEIVLAVNHQADILKAYFGNGERLGVSISYSLENTPLGTMGPLRLIDDLPDNFIIMNGDILCDLNYGSFFEGHIKRGSVFSISAATRTHTIDYGVLECDPESNLSGFREKPTSNFLVSMGVYCANRAILSEIPPNTQYGFDKLMLNLLSKDRKVHVARHEGYWLDIGRPDDYHRAVDEWPALKAKLGL